MNHAKNDSKKYKINEYAVSWVPQILESVLCETLSCYAGNWNVLQNRVMRNRVVRDRVMRGPPVYFFLWMKNIYIRTQKYLKKIQPEHQKNLPAKNALTFLDTYILLLSLAVRFILAKLIFYLHQQEYFSFEVSLTVRIILNLCLNDVFLGLVFPLYIMLKTRRYLPKLWNDDCPHVQQNNDFFAQRPDENQEDQDIVESSF